MTGSAAGSYWPMLKAYHNVREALYRQIIADTLAGYPPPALILDAGTGDGFYARLLAEVLGPQTRVVALDIDAGLLCRQPRQAQVSPCQSNLERAGLRPGAFDAVWLCRTLHSSTDPARRIRAVARQLRPGGRLVVVENDFAHHPILGWPADFEQRVFAAHYSYLQSRCTGGALLERYYGARYLPGWLAAAGLTATFIHTYVAEDRAPLPAPTALYWRLFLAWLGGRVLPYLGESDRARYLDLSDPASPHYLPAQRDAYCVELTTVVCGVAPD